MSKEIWAGEVGDEYDAMKKSWSENANLLGIPFADFIEDLKMSAPKGGGTYIVTEVDTQNKVITLGNQGVKK